jgi:phosphoribosylanthranilate isomerase
MYIKICGVTDPADVRLLAQSPANLCGIWHGVDGGHADLSLDRFNFLVRETRTAAELDAVLVTFINDPKRLRNVVTQSEVGWVQLHGFQPPSLVANLKAEFGPRLQVIKAVHLPVRHGVIGPLISAYERAGVDLFLFDAFTADGRLGSSGHLVDTELIRQVANRLAVPFLVAGGISAKTLSHYRDVLRHTRFVGIDVDTGARGPDGKFCDASIVDIGRYLTTYCDTEHGYETALR